MILTRKLKFGARRAFCKSSVAAKLGIADLLKDGPKSSDELAQATGTHGRSLYRLLRALASVGVFAEAEDGRFELTPLGECLQTGIPGSVRAITVNFGERDYRAWGDLLHSVRKCDRGSVGIVPKKMAG